LQNEPTAAFRYQECGGGFFMDMECAGAKGRAIDDRPYTVEQHYI